MTLESFKSFLTYCQKLEIKTLEDLAQFTRHEARAGETTAQALARYCQEEEKEEKEKKEIKK